MATSLAKDRAARNLRKQSTAPHGMSSLQQLKPAAGGKYNNEESFPDEVFDSDESSFSVTSEADPQQQQQLTTQPLVYPSVRLENTYRLGPTADGQFPLARTSRLLKQLLTDYLAGENYEEDFARSMSQSISQAIRARVKDLQPAGSRYKIIALCSIGAQGPHALSLASRCLWDEAVDSYVTCQFANSSLYAVATVFAVYQE